MASSSLSASQMEQKILTEFLLTRSALPDIIPLEKFRQLFPKNLQKHPHVQYLYQGLQEQRSSQCDKVRKNIQLEAKLGRTQRRIMEKEMKKLKEEDKKAEEDDMMLGMVDIFGAPASKSQTQALSLDAVLDKLNEANEALELEFAQLDADCNKKLAEMKEIVGDLSDLRYGRIDEQKQKDTVEQLIVGLENLQDECDESSKS